MAVVTLNRLVLEQAANEIVEEVRSATREFEQAAENIQVRAGSLLAQRVRDCAALLRQEVVKDIGNPSAQARQRIEAAGQTNGRHAVLSWAAIGVVAGTVLFGCGVWLGTLLR
jgi:hypothetical protein